MEIVGIKYIAPLYDNSGYAKASRSYVLALHQAGVPVTTVPISFEQDKPDLGKDGSVLKSLEKKDIPYNIVLIHTTPEFWSKYREEGKTNIGYTIWETTKLHDDWPVYINRDVDKVLVGCHWNVKVFKESGVTIPIASVPHCTELVDPSTVVPYDVAGVDKDTFMFYSILQWTERKSPLSTIKAYWHAFQNNENVALVLKTYRSDYSDREKDAIRSTMGFLKAATPFNRYPKVFLILDMLSEEEILGLHARGDCYVSLDRGEGFGLSPFAAGSFGKPIIVTGFGGVNEYAKSNNSYLVDYTLTPVGGMPWSPWYRGDQAWAEPAICHGASCMKYVYNHKEEAKERGAELKEYITQNFSFDKIAKKLIQELNNM